jgi:membrane protein
MFKFLPDAQVRWRDVWLGSGITAGLFTAGKFLIGLYLGKSGVAGKYGAAGSLVVFLVWVYYSAQILFIGAEFTRVWAEHHGGLNPPDEDAKRVVHRKAELSQTRS